MAEQLYGSMQLQGIWGVVDDSPMVLHIAEAAHFCKRPVGANIEPVGAVGV